MSKPMLFEDTHEQDMEAMTRYRIPEYRIPWPVALNPDHALAEQEARRWSERFGLLNSEAARQRMTDMQSGLFSGWWCPRTDTLGAVLQAKWVAWLFLWDDMFDDGPQGRNPDVFLHGKAELDYVLSGKPPPPSDDPRISLPHARALADLWGDFFHYFPEHPRRRFADHVRQYLCAMRREVDNRSAEELQGVDAYLRLRLVNGATRPSIDTLEGLQGANIPDHVHRGLFYELRDMAAELWLWSNDTFTVRKDLHYRNPHNLVLVLRHDRDLSLQEAANHVAYMVEQRLRDFTRVADRLRRLTGVAEDPHAACKDDVLRGIRILEDGLSGYYRWQESCLRYKRREGFLTPAVDGERPEGR
ncbi:terpene synthase family protein [Streptomyces sp. HU2014]|uniref:terpene synthase family protein n=1 Tax=Streptomyces sp. HU2014 TaxID=2939414 RepID=UPI00200CEBD3|nr:terpene synthase family protein [Streptomyces sp. HU2014]UQI46044.1 terpene synthase family protein [Streptomyces sp. HU2014]